MAKAKGLEMATNWLVAIGALNWGAAEFGFNIVEKLMTSFPQGISWTYMAVGAAGAYKIYLMLTE
jgi:uncharacterized membrane protein YuzA (DUF378 family)